MKRMMERALLFLVLLSLMILLPYASMGEAQPAVAKGIEAKKMDGSGVSALQLLSKLLSEMPQLPQGSKPVQKIIPRRCMVVRHHYLVTIPVVVAPATLSALSDLQLSWNERELRFDDIGFHAGKDRMTLYLTFRAMGIPTDTTRVSFKSLTRKSAKSQAYVTIVPTPVSRVAIDPPAATLAVGEGQQFDAYVYPKEVTNRAVRWSSTNKSVATVSSTGLVTGIKPGVAIIYATSVSGHKKGKCVITVVPPVPVD